MYIFSMSLNGSFHILFKKKGESFLEDLSIGNHVDNFQEMY